MRIVVDTNVVFEGLTQQESASGLIVSAWREGLFEVCVSNSLLYEYESTLSRELSPQRWQVIRPNLQQLLNRVHFVRTRYNWRPLSPDPGDEHVIECALNAGGTLVTYNLRDFRQAQIEVGLAVLSPMQFVELFYREDTKWGNQP